MQQQKKDSQQKLSRKEELGQTSGDTPAEGDEEDEYLEEWHKNFSQVAETKTPTALKLTTEEEHTVKMLTPWEMELEMLEDWLNHPEPVDDCHEETVMQMMTAALRSAAKGESEFQSEEQLEEVGAEPVGELAEAKLSEKEAEQ
jgi:hypothetical protein